MPKQFYSFFLFLNIAAFSLGETQKVDLLETGKFSWNGNNLDSRTIIVTAKNYAISVTVEVCDIGDQNAKPNNQYLILKQENDDISGKNVRVFAYIKEPKKIYFYSDSVVMELKTTTPLNKDCKVIFEKDEKHTTPIPITTTEITPTLDPKVSNISIILISGKSVQQYNKDKSLLMEIKTNLVKMAINYTTTEGFCLKDGEKIQTSDVKINMLEQCPSKWSNFENCVRLGYALPVKINESCSLWKGYQITGHHLDIMWLRMAKDYFQGELRVYEEPEVNSVMTWWIVCIIFTLFVFICVTIAVNFTWKRRQIMKREKGYQNEFLPETRRVFESSTSPSKFQSIPPMFEKIHTSTVQHPIGIIIGADNQAFEYDELQNTEEEGTSSI